MVVVQGAEPFYFQSAPRPSTAVLLIHGFTSSPHSMRELGQKLFEAGFDAKGLLLPGHGTTPLDMEKMKWTDWYGAVENELLELRKHYQKVFLCGQSMGGCLSLYASTYHAVNGVITISSGIRLFDRQLFFVPFVKYFYRFQKKTGGPDVKDPEAKRAEVHYDLMPLRSIHELQKLLARLRQRISGVEAPVLLIHAREDHTFDFRNQNLIFDSVASAVKKKIVLENSYHIATVDYDKTTVQRETIDFIRQVCK